MIHDHEYAVLGGLNRAKVGHTVGIVAAFVASGISSAALALIGLVKALGFVTEIPPIILWPLGISAVYGGLYYLFNKYLWKWSRLAGLLRVPNLSGTWLCEGQSFKSDKSPDRSWQGEVTIIQTWDKIRVRLKTDQSGSNSIAAALVYDEADGFRLLYNYRNDPKIGEQELASHRGFADLTFSHDLRSADGEYFNGQGRYTFGTMRLTKVD